MTKHDGGPAFPTTYLWHDEEQARTAATGTQRGMTLRDWFAGRALEGRMASGNWSASEEYIANEVEVAYRIADAMLAEREKHQQEEE